MCIAIPVVSSSQTKKNTPEELPGDLAIWFFIFAELLVFGVLFITYIVARGQNIELFNSTQQTLNTQLGLFNTLVLITSSLFVVKAINAIKRDQQDKSVFWLLMAILSGLLFVLAKTSEFNSLFDTGISLGTNLFYTFYISMTFFHYMHVILGLVILAAVFLKARRGGYTADNHIGMETGASYWHMVDLVWIVLFPLVYLVR